MQQRLIEMGKWLKINGEAIYGTRAFIKTKKNEEINEETNKSVFFTRKNNEIYIICLNWPAKGIVLKGITPGNMVKVALLGTDKAPSVKGSGGNLFITAPDLTPDDNQIAYVFKVSGLLN
jgi:alpha-L-fucosidase